MYLKRTQIELESSRIKKGLINWIRELYDWISELYNSIREPSNFTYPYMN